MSLDSLCARGDGGQIGCGSKGIVLLPPIGVTSARSAWQCLAADRSRMWGSPSAGTVHAVRRAGLDAQNRPDTDYRSTDHHDITTAELRLGKPCVSRDLSIGASPGTGLSCRSKADTRVHPLWDFPDGALAGRHGVPEWPLSCRAAPAGRVCDHVPSVINKGSVSCYRI
jgi:hypothetical protein